MPRHLKIRLSIGHVVSFTKESKGYDLVDYFELEFFIKEETGCGGYNLLDAVDLDVFGVPSVSDLKSRQPISRGLILGSQGTNGYG